jgi:hypothetical protein
MVFKRQNNVSGVEFVQVSLWRGSQNKSQLVSESMDRNKNDEGLASQVSHVAVLEGPATREGVDLIAIGHEHNSRKPKETCLLCLSQG